MIYNITKGILSTDDGEIVLEHCYAGGDAGLRPDAANNPAFMNRQNIGPLPVGTYFINPLATHIHLGPSMALNPDPANQMFGRGGFFIHYSNPARDKGLAPYPPTPGRNSSDGCIVSIVPGSLNAVEKLRAAGDSILTVTA